MIDSIKIKNYRNLDNFQLNNLGRVNLITGNNNTGKSTLLEAISLYIAKFDINWILTLLQERGEFYDINSTNAHEIFNNNIKMFSALFTGRKIEFFNEDRAIQIYENNHVDKLKILSFRFIKFIEEYKASEKENRTTINFTKKIITKKEKLLYPNEQIGLDIKDYGIIHLNKRLNYYFYKEDNFLKNFQFIRTRNIESELNATLWDKIALTSKEDYVIKALQIIEPDIQGLRFIDNNNRDRNSKRIPVIKLKNQENILPLKSMGDGINRVLTIILALVNADNGYLLIDEFENGLHYSVQEKLWKIIFTIAKELNIQVFATTHSNDCIYSFEEIVNSQTSFQDSKLIRLDNVNGVIKQVKYNAEELKIATNQDIETR